MPIKALEQFKRPPIAGYAKLGGKEAKERKSKSGVTWRAPVRFPDFRMVKLRRDDNDNFVMDGRLQWKLKVWNANEEERAAFAAGKTPKEKADAVRHVLVREIPIRLLSDDVDECLETDYVRYRGTHLYRKCDGERCRLWDIRKGKKGYEKASQRTKVVDCMCPKYEDTGLVNPHGGKGEICSPSARLSFFVAIEDEDDSGRGLAATFGACYQFRTKGWNSIRKLRGSLIDVKSRVGKLTGVPLVLVASEVHTKDVHGTTRKFLAAHVECRVDIYEAITGARALHESRNRLAMLGEIHSVPSESAAEIRRQDEQNAPEYHPDQTHQEEHKEYEMEQNEDGEFQSVDDPDEPLFPDDDGIVTDPGGRPEEPVDPNNPPIEHKRKVVSIYYDDYKKLGGKLEWNDVCVKAEVDPVAVAMADDDALEAIAKWLHDWILANNSQDAVGTEEFGGSDFDDEIPWK